MVDILDSLEPEERKAFLKEMEDKYLIDFSRPEEIEELRKVGGLEKEFEHFVATRKISRASDSEVAEFKGFAKTHRSTSEVSEELIDHVVKEARGGSTTALNDKFGYELWRAYIKSAYIDFLGKKPAFWKNAELFKEHEDDPEFREWVENVHAKGSYHVNQEVWDRMGKGWENLPELLHDFGQYKDFNEFMATLPEVEQREMREKYHAWPSDFREKFDIMTADRVDASLLKQRIDSSDEVFRRHHEEMKRGIEELKAVLRKGGSRDVERIDEEGILKSIHYLFPNVTDDREIKRPDQHWLGMGGENMGTTYAFNGIHDAISFRDIQKIKDVLPILAEIYANHVAAHAELTDLFEKGRLKGDGHRAFLPEFRGLEREAVLKEVERADTKPMSMLDIGPGLRGVQTLENWKVFGRKGKITMVEKDRLTTLFLREYARLRGIGNAEIVHKDVMDYVPKEKFDHVRADLVVNTLYSTPWGRDRSEGEEERKEAEAVGRFGKHVVDNLMKRNGAFEMGEAMEGSRYFGMMRKGMGKGIEMKARGRKVLFSRKKPRK